MTSNYRWNRGSNVRSQGLKKKKKNLRPRTDFSKTDPSEAKDRNGRAEDQGHNFSKLWSANFRLFLSAQVLKVFDDILSSF